MTSGAKQPNFHDLGISPEILQVIDGMSFTAPTPIQQKAIPTAIEGKDLLGIAQTGTGKTLGFGIPMIQRLLQGPGRALILVPTRELALQVDETIRKLGNPPSGVRIASQAPQRSLGPCEEARASQGPVFGEVRDDA